MARAGIGLATLLGASLLVGCSGSGPETATAPSVSTGVVATTTSEAPPTVAPTPPSTASATSLGPSTTVAVTSEPNASVVIVTDPPQTGVPGVTSDEEFCGFYGTIALTAHEVAMVEAFGDVETARRAEVIAASPFLAALAGATASVPAGASWGDEVSGRWGRYAARAALVPPLPTSADVIWRAVLDTHDRNDPNLVLELPAELTAPVDDAAAALTAAAGPLGEDQAYLDSTAAPTAGIDGFLATHCPDVAALTAPDEI